MKIPGITLRSAHPTILVVSDWVFHNEQIFDALKNCGPGPIWLLSLVSWHLDSSQKERIKNLTDICRVWRDLGRDHHLLFLANTREELALLNTSGIPAIWCHQNALIDEDVFRPLPDTTREFDAVYNARLSPFKRHALAGNIPRLSLIAPFFPDGRDPEYEAEVRRQFADAHWVIDPFSDPDVLLQPEEVNQAINRAHVGLCLSPSEGAMFASTEYLLAGLPVVTTESEGGREVLFDDQFCSIVADDPAAIAEAVCHWKQRAPGPAHIRAKTLEKMMPHRARLGNLVKKILAHHGAHAAAAKWLIPTLPNKLAGHRYLTEDSNLKPLREAPAGFSVRLHTIKNSVTGLLKSKEHTAMALTHSVMPDKS